MGNFEGRLPSRFIAELAPADREPEDLPFDQWSIR